VRFARSVTIAMFAVVASVAPSVGAATRGTYVAVGDSYSSGAGLGPYLAGAAGCERSRESFPTRIARSQPGLRFDFLACAGATTSQVQAQVSGARTALGHAALVTVTAGGNDLSFSNLLTSCVGGALTASSTVVRYYGVVSGTTACTRAVTTAAGLLGASLDPSTGTLRAPWSVTDANQTAQSPLEHRLGALLRSVLSSSTSGNGGSGARVVMVDYPILIGAPTTPVCLVGPAPLRFSSAAGLYPAFPAIAANELLAVNMLLRRETATVVARLRAHASRLVLANPVRFQPINCATGTSRDLNGLTLASLESGGSFHPTAMGQTVLAGAVRNQLRR